MTKQNDGRVITIHTGFSSSSAHGQEVICDVSGSAYLSPVAGLPFGAAPSATPSPPAGFRGQTPAVFLRHDQARRGDTADFTRPEAASAGSRTLQDAQGKKGFNVTPMPFI